MLARPQGPAGPIRCAPLGLCAEGVVMPTKTSLTLPTAEELDTAADALSPGFDAIEKVIWRVEQIVKGYMG